MSWRAALDLLRRAPAARPAAEIAADVQAELEHHLACLEHELIAAGETPERARAAARARFGDPAAIQAACLGIQMGERLVLQRIHLAVTLLLLVAVLFLAWANHRSSVAALRATEAAMSLRAEALHRAAEARQPVEHVVVEVGDRLQIVDQYNPDVHGVLEVAEDGKVPLPQAGWVFVAGMTREQVEQALTKALEDYFVSSDVRVIVRKAPRVPVDFHSVEFESF